MFGGSDGMNTITPHYEYGLKFTRGKPQVIELTRPRETKDLQVSGLEWEDVRSTVRSENQIYRELVEKEYDKAFEILKKRHWRKALDTSGLEQLRKASRKPLTEIKQQQLRNLAKARADMEAKRPITLSVQYDRPFTLEKLDDVMMYNSSQKFSRAMVKANPDHLFVYETNVEDAKNPKKKGLGNARIKGLTNTIGIRSRPKPGKEDYWVEQTAEEKKKVQKIIEEDLKKLKEKMKDKKVVFLNSGYWNGSPPGDLKGVTPYKELFSEMISEVVPGYENIKHQRGQSDWEDYNAARNYDNSFLKGTNEIPDNVMRELVAERMEKNKELSAEQARDEIIRDGAASEYYKGIVDIRKEQETIRELVERTTGYEEYIQHKDIEGSDYQQRSDTPVYHAKVTDVTKTTKTEKRINKKGQTEEYSYSSYEARLIPKYRMKRNVQAYGGKTYTTVERHRNYNENVHFDPSTTEITGLKKEDARAYTRPLTFTKKLIDIAVMSGCDAVKFQKRNPDVCVPNHQKDIIRNTPWGKMSYLEYKYKIEFNRKEYNEIDRYCKERGIAWSASPWDLDSLEFLSQYDIPFIKIPSAMITNEDLMFAAKRTGKKVIISTGMSTFDEIERAITILKLPGDTAKTLRPFNFGEELNTNFAVLHCNSTYPAPLNELNLSAIKTLKDRFKCEVGYSGHEFRLGTSVAAVYLGATIIERHITLDRTMWGTDQLSSVEPQGLIKLVKGIRELEESFGNGKIIVTESEKLVRKKLRK